MQAEDVLTFWAKGKVGAEGHRFRYDLVLKESRSPDGPPRLYLHDKPHGISIHLKLFDSLSGKPAPSALEASAL